jgi:hypothetical protein
MADPQKYYRLQSLASRGFYVPGVIPFEEIASENQLMLLKHKNNMQSNASSTPRSRKPGQRKTKGPGGPHSVAFQDLVPEEQMQRPGSYMTELENDNLSRKGVR